MAMTLLISVPCRCDAYRLPSGGAGGMTALAFLLRGPRLCVEKHSCSRLFTGCGNGVCFAVPLFYCQIENC